LPLRRRPGWPLDLGLVPAPAKSVRSHTGRAQARARPSQFTSIALSSLNSVESVLDHFIADLGEGDPAAACAYLDDLKNQIVERAASRAKLVTNGLNGHGPEMKPQNRAKRHKRDQLPNFARSSRGNPWDDPGRRASVDRALA
jgi:hypothetical protein